MLKRSATRLGWLAASIALVLVQCQSTETRKRIVLITLDTLRYDAVFPPEEEDTAMPLLWNRAQAGTRFARFYATTSVTQPTHASLFTSLPPWEHGVTRNGQTLTDTHTTLAELLHDAGYETHAVAASFPLSMRFGFGQGFDHYFEEFTMGELKTWKAHDVPESKFYSLADSITTRAIEQISEATGDLQFFWFHFFDPHAPYGVTRGQRFSEARILSALERGEGTREGLLNRARRLYRLDVAYLDTSLDRLLARLDTDSERFETHIFVTSDHGESFGEGDSLGHGSRLSAAEIHVPAFFISPKLKPGRRNDVAGAIDVAPTLLSLAGLPSRASELSGRDLSSTDIRPPGIWGMRRTSAGAKIREKRLDGRTHLLPKYWFYSIDPQGRIHRGNARHVVISEAEDANTNVEELEASFRSFEVRLEANQQSTILDPATKAGLEALGYAQ